MVRRDITGVDSTIGSEFKKGMNRYNATTSFRRDGVTYFIEINDMYGTNVIATWWDNSDNGFGYNNYGDVYVNNPFNRMTGSFSPENIDDYIGVNSAYDRNLPASLKKAIINRVKRYIDYDALNDVRRTESIKKGSKSNMKLRISEDVGKKDTVYVVFRKERKPTDDERFYGNDVTAFIYGDGIPVNYGKIMAYQHVGQHGEASIEYYNSLKPASPEEYEDLYSELKAIYDDVNLVVRKKVDYNILRNEWR